MNISKRQQHIVDAIPKNTKVLADVGCDHGIIGATALVNGSASKTVFCDISAKCLDKALQLCNVLKLTGTEFVCQDGLSDIVCDTAVIAGMGGLEIIKIMDKAQHKPEYLVLQPMHNQYQLREYLQKQYNIVLDYKLLDKKYYDIIVAQLRKGSQIDCTPLTEEQLIFGKTNLTNPTEDFCLYVKTEIAKCKEILANNSVFEVEKRQELLSRIGETICKKKF